MELIFVVIIILGIFYVISKNDKGAVISPNSINSSNHVNCKICKDKLSESTHKYELINQDGGSKTILCNSCYVTFRNENNMVDHPIDYLDQLERKKKKRLNSEDVIGIDMDSSDDGWVIGHIAAFPFAGVSG